MICCFEYYLMLYYVKEKCVLKDSDTEKQVILEHNYLCSGSVNYLTIFQFSKTSLLISIGSKNWVLLVQHNITVLLNAGKFQYLGFKVFFFSKFEMCEALWQKKAELGGVP